MGTVPTYDAVHKRIRAERGPAAHHACAWCGRTADDWAYQHNGCASELLSPSGHPYSPDLSCYKPLCWEDHRTFDRLINQDSELSRLRLLVRSAESFLSVTDERAAFDRAVRERAKAAAAAYAASVAKPAHSAFIATLEPGATVYGSTLLAQYRRWCVVNDLKPVGQRTFYGWLVDNHGFERSARGGIAVFTVPAAAYSR
ncbi:hypothetical protein [Streptomyces sp. KR55]|uniref:hypothetical protein n=1 Tax=Streptomyces sp. KR55 TaxID=3457425 RepID=UPI003FCF234A